MSKGQLKELPTAKAVGQKSTYLQVDAYRYPFFLPSGNAGQQQKKIIKRVVPF